ncbi:MAG TPA: GYF domain-containing protein [Polyangiaceae bacterium]
MAFPITCPSCGKGFQLATEIYERKVAGKVVSIRCKQCQAAIRVDATTPGELKVSGATAAAGTDSGTPKQASIHDAEPAGDSKVAANPIRARQPTLLGMIGPGGQVAKGLQPQRAAAAPPAPPPPPPEAPLWAVDAGGAGDDRELTDEQMKREIEAGVLGPATLVWREGQEDWLEISKVPQLAQYLNRPKDAPPAPRPRLPSAPGVDAPRPKLPSRPEVEEEEATMIYARGKAKAAAFELPELPQDYDPAPPPPPLPAAGRPAVPLPAAGRPPSAPKAAPPPPGLGHTQPLAAPAPPPLPGSSPLAATPPPFPAEPAPAPWPNMAPNLMPPPAAQPGFPTPPPFAATQPLAKPASSSPPAAQQAAIPWGPGAPAPSPVGVMPPSPFAVSPTTTDLDFPKPKSKLPLVIGALVAVAAVIGIVVAMSSGSRPAPVPTPAVPPPKPALTATAETTATPTATEAPTPPPNPQGNPLAPPETPSNTKTGGGFSDLFAQGVEKAEKSGTVQTPSQPFNKDEAVRAVAALLKTVAACREPGSPVGQTSASVTFESTGKVSSVTIGAPFAGTSTGTCMVTAFKQAKVTPFAGLPGTVSQAVSLR